MDLTNLLVSLLTEFYDKLKKIETYIPRLYAFSPIEDKINVVIGMRRCGKTVFILQTIAALIAKGIDKHSILYINFEDDRLLPCDQSKLAALLDSFYSLYPENHDRKCYLFLDEIQNVEDWALVVRRFFDSKDVKLYLTGSSAKLLSKDLHTALRGRSLAKEIWPFSFKEYLHATNFELPATPYPTKVNDQLMQQLKTYIKRGGFPGTINIDDTDRLTILQEYVELVIMKDIVERYKVENITLLKYLLQNLLKNVGSAFSANKFSNDIKSQGITGSKASVLDYLLYLEDAYLIFPVSIYAESIRKMHVNNRKIYAVDPGLVNAYRFSNHQDFGHLFENIFYLYLRRTKHKIYYYLTQKDRYEVDFFTQRPNGEKHLYQICWDTTEKTTLERESRALEIAMHELNVPGTLITPQIFLNKFLD